MSSPALNLTSLPPWGNPLAPQWFGLTPLLSKWTDVETDIALPVTIDAGITLDGANALTLSIDNDADVILREFQFAFIGDNAGVALTDLRVRIHDGDGALVTLEYVTVIDIMGTVPQLGFRRGCQLVFDVKNVGAATITGQIILKCVKRTACENRSPIVVPYVPMYKRFSQPPAGFHDEAYSLYFEIPLGGANPTAIAQLPLPNDIDADFLWRGLGGNSQIGQSLLRLYNHNNVPLFDSLTPYECATSNNPGAFSPFSSEVLIPRGGVIFGDFEIAPGGDDPQTVKLSLRGVKRYQD